MRIGFARAVPGQKKFFLETQIAELEAAGCDCVTECQMSAGSHGQIAAISKVIEELKPGDTLIVTGLGRLGKPIKAILEMLADSENSFKAREIGFISLAEGINTTPSAPSGTFLPNFAAHAAKMARELILERTTISQQAAKDQNKQTGRPHKISDEDIERARRLIKDQGMSVRDAAKVIEAGSATVYRRLDVFLARGKSSV